ncbi:hypothetical protein, partial [Poseidonibacter sp.]|uniref:hypothetical protein n=1 Tax=Poseidonibacter sp. TaxID=2321188 RepID=UPI003C72C733
SLLPKVLEDICFNDKDLLLPNYNEFVEQVVNPKLYAGIIGNVYSQHDDLNTAFKYFHIEFKERKDINVAITILHLSQVYYHRFYKNIDIVKQSEVFNFVLGRLDELEINLLIALFGYSVIINKDTSSVFPTINQYLLREDIKEMNNDIKIRFSDIHIHTMSFVKDLYQKAILIDTNLCLEKDGKTYIKDMYEVNDENIKNYGFLTISEDDYNLKKQNEDYTEGSLLHRITGVFAYRCDNPNMVMIDVKNDFSELFKMMEEHKQLKIKTFEDFNNGNIVTFYNLAEKDYKKYFTLIPKLLNDENYNLDSGQYNYLSKETPKILTFSSIILLNELNYLEEVLKKEEIFIQRTLMRFLISYKESLEENSSEIPKFNSTDCQFTFFLETEYFTEKEKIISLINRLIKYERIIEDDKEVLPIKESATRITENFGVQEYHALAYSHKNNYQIITEDRTFVHLFQGFNFNPIMVSNSISLIKDVLSIDDFNNLKIELHKKKYKNLIEVNYLTILKKFMFFNNIDKISESERKFLKLIIEDYKAIDDLKEFGEVFDLKHFLSNPPRKMLYDINLEKLLKPKE